MPVLTAHENQLITELKKLVVDTFPLSHLNNEELKERIEALVQEKTQSQYYSIEKKFLLDSKYTVPYAVLICWTQ